MGRVKEEMMRQQELLEEATSIAVTAGVLERCELHPEIVWETHVDPVAAYKLGNAEDLPGEPGGVLVPGHRGSLPSSARRPGGLGACVLQAVAAAACGGLTVAPVVRRSVGGCQPGFSRALVASAL